MKTKVALIALVILAGQPNVAVASVLNLTCTYLDMKSRGLDTVCDGGCETVALTVDTVKQSVTVPVSKLLEPGTFTTTITDSAIDWDAEHYHYELSRYTPLQLSVDAKHAEQMSNVTYDYKCTLVQKQF